MSFNATPVDGSNPAIPMASAISPGDKTPRAIMGGPETTDGQGNILVPVAVYVPDGNDVTLGASTDAANANSIMGQLKQIKTNTTSVTIGAALPTGGNVIGVVAYGGTTAVGVPANSGVVSVKIGAGRLASVIVTTSGTAQLNLYDNASIAAGTIIGAVPANAAVGSVYAFNSPAVNGILANSVANCCSVTICYY